MEINGVNIRQVNKLNFKRKEGFRFTFGTPVRGNARVLVGDEVVDAKAETITIDIIDISPKGMKLVTLHNIDNAVLREVTLEVTLCIDTAVIEAHGEIVWKRSAGNACAYGLFFKEQSVNEELIIEELKIRRRKEMKLGTQSK